MRRIVPAILALVLLGGAAPSLAAPCKDAKGKFIKCPPAKPVPCKDTKGKFVKCGTPGAKPIK
jgi:hypothetical protein